MLLRSSQARHFAPSPTHEKRLSTRHGMCLWIDFFCCRRKAIVLPPGHPLSSFSGRQRSNTLYFARKVCANRVLHAPIGNPAPRGFSPWDTPLFLTAKGYPNHQKRFGTHAGKNRKSKNLLAAAWRNSGFSSMGGCCGFENSHGGATMETRRKLPTCALLHLSPIFINDFLSPIFVACFLKCKR